MLNTVYIEYSLECFRVITSTFYHLTLQQPPAPNISSTDDIFDNLLQSSVRKFRVFVDKNIYLETTKFSNWMISLFLSVYSPASVRLQFTSVQFTSKDFNSDLIILINLFQLTGAREEALDLALDLARACSLTSALSTAPDRLVCTWRYLARFRAAISSAWKNICSLMEVTLCFYSLTAYSNMYNATS